MYRTLLSVFRKVRPILEPLFPFSLVFVDVHLPVPKITKEPVSQENVIPGKPAEFAVKAIGGDLTYTWHRQTANNLLPNGKRVPVPGNSQTLRINEVHSSDEGYYVCTVRDRSTGGSVETQPAQLTTEPQITEEPHSQKNVTPGQPTEFVVRATGKNLTYTWHHQTAKRLLSSDVGTYNVDSFHIGNVQSNNEGNYVCTIRNPTGGEVKTKPAQLTIRTSLWSKCGHPVVVAAIVLVIAMAGGIILNMWQCNIAMGFQTPGQPEAISCGPVNQEGLDVNCHRIENSRDLFKELHSITDWEMLCYNLGVSERKIDSIKHTYMYHSYIAHSKKECLNAFCKQSGGCWEKVVTVVSDPPFENKRLAKKIADRHGVEYSVD